MKFDIYILWKFEKGKLIKIISLMHEMDPSKSDWWVEYLNRSDIDGIIVADNSDVVSFDNGDNFKDILIVLIDGHWYKFELVRSLYFETLTYYIPKDASYPTAISDIKDTLKYISTDVYNKIFTPDWVTLPSDNVNESASEEKKPIYILTQTADYNGIDISIEITDKTPIYIRKLGKMAYVFDMNTRKWCEIGKMKWYHKIRDGYRMAYVLEGDGSIGVIKQSGLYCCFVSTIDFRQYLFKHDISTFVKYRDERYI